MILYNVPGRTGVNLLPETVGRLSQINNIIGIKEATGSLQQCTEVMEKVKSGFLLISGDDFINLPILSIGGVGTISVTANIVPSELSKMCKEFEKGNLQEARKIHIDLMPIHRAMFIETNPIPVKTASYIMGLIQTLEFRLPLCPMKKENEEKLRDALKTKSLIS